MYVWPEKLREREKKKTFSAFLVLHTVRYLIILNHCLFTIDSGGLQWTAFFSEPPSVGQWCPTCLIQPNTFICQEKVRATPGKSSTICKLVRQRAR